MPFFTIKNNDELFMACIMSWRGRSLESIDRVGPAKAELIKKAFLSLHWLVWFCHNHPEETKLFLSELKDPRGLATHGLFPVKYKLGDAVASNVIHRFGRSSSYGTGMKPPRPILEMIGVAEEEPAEKSNISK